MLTDHRAEHATAIAAVRAELAALGAQPVPSLPAALALWRPPGEPGGPPPDMPPRLHVDE